MDLALAAVRFALDQNLPDQRSDGIDRVRHGEEPHAVLARVRQTRMDALADGPDLGLCREAARVLIA